MQNHMGDRTDFELVPPQQHKRRVRWKDGMSEPERERPRLIITESETERAEPHSPQQKITQARNQLYQLLASLRKDAERASDPSTQTVFEFSAEVIAGLARALRRYEDEIKARNRDTTE